MRRAIFGLACVLGLGPTGGLAQPAGDASEKLHVCAALEHTERLACLEGLSREATPSPPRPAGGVRGAATSPRTDIWIFSETTSPVDYAPVVTATALTADTAAAAMRLSIRCTNGRTDLLIDGSALAGRGEDYAVSYAIDDGPATFLPAGTAASGVGIRIRADIPRLLASLPDHGDIGLRVTGKRGEVLEGRFGLTAATTLLKRMAPACKWPTLDSQRN